MGRVQPHAPRVLVTPQNLSCTSRFQTNICDIIFPPYILNTSNIELNIRIFAGKMLCYCRLVYMPMSYLYGKRFVGPLTPLIQLLRKELYIQPYHDINWNKARNTCAKVKIYTYSTHKYKNNPIKT